MATKNNIRSIRFSDKLAELIDRQIGKTFTEKFENLVTRCVWELPQKEAERKAIQEQIERERQKLRELHQKRWALQQAIDGLSQKMQQCIDAVDQTMQQLEEM